MTARLRVGVAACCLIVAAAGHSPAVAADEFEETMKRGTAFRREGRDAEALAEFQKASKLRPSPRATAQMAMAEQALGLWVEANQHLAQALESGGDPWIAKNRGTLESVRTTIQQHLCRVDFWGAPAGAEIAIDGKTVGTLPATQVWVLSGELSFEARAPGFATFRRTMKTAEGTVVREHVQLRAAQAAAAPESAATSATQARPVAAAPSPLPPAAAPSAESTPLISAQPEPEPAAGGDGGWWTKWWVWTIVGAGVVAAGGTAWVLTHRTTSCDRAPCTTWN